MRTKMFVYSIPPIDYWAGWQGKDDYIKDCVAEGYQETTDSIGHQLDEIIQRAERLAQRGGWEGDYREGPYFSAIPGSGGDPSSAVLIGWKQDNDGTTFIASPFPLPWIAEWQVAAEQ